jgi:hypothetical protein
MSVIEGTNGGDRLNGTSGADRIVGNVGNDLIDGGDGDDAIYAGSLIKSLDLNGLVVSETVKAHIEIESVSKNDATAIGYYRIGADGKISGVDVLFAGPGSKSYGAGTSVDVELKAGEKLGFFVLNKEYAKGKNANLLSDANAGWELRTPDVKPATVSDNNLVLWYVDPNTGKATSMAVSGTASATPRKAIPSTPTARSMPRPPSAS